LAITFLVATVLNLVRNTWELAFDITWVISGKSQPEYVRVVDPILDVWTTFVVLVLIFAIGCQNEKGLWSRNAELVYEMT
jgi:hypothetical protein